VNTLCDDRLRISYSQGDGTVLTETAEDSMHGTRSARTEQVLRWSWALIDAAVWMLAVCGASWLRDDFSRQGVTSPAVLWQAAMTALAYVLVGAFVGPYAVGHERGSFEETLDIARTAAVAITGVFVWVLLTHAERPNLSPSVPVMAGVLAVTGMFAVRFVIRAWRTNKVAARAAQKRVILLGAGEAGRRLVRHMLRDPNSGFSPVALLDDDRAKGRLRVEGVRVRGTRASMAAVAVEYDASTLVTGAGGSIGSELCRQIVRFGPPKLYLLDRDESGIHATQLSLTGQGLLEGDEVVLTDIRDAAAVREVFAQTRPDIVFHAAALKHLPLLEQYPLEAWKTNVLGTLNVLRAAAAAGVGTFVNISTDKAASPICALGYSKRLAERITADFARTQPGRYVSVRFGNVLRSRGSVLHAFTTEIERGGPVTVTHPEVERFFMLIPEAWADSTGRRNTSITEV